ncbi:MAG: hypothetical protein CL510_02755 [Actinobacteria bacterium]|nr:hypothetical protein [Actinomycetota bacterium]
MITVSVRSLFVVVVLVLGLGSCRSDDNGDTGSEEGSAPGDCTDGADNDLDGLFDCEDGGCSDTADCAGDDDTSALDDDDAPAGDDDSAGDDDDTLDDDDVADDDDSSADDDDVPPPPTEDCANSQDDDADGAIDCDDDDCDSYPPCFGGECGVEVDTEDVGCADGIDGDCDGLVDCEDVGSCCFYTEPGQDCEGSPFCDSGDDDAGGDDDDSSSDLPPCCDTQTCPDNVLDCGGDPDNVCEQLGMPWQGDDAGDGPDHCADFSEAACASCYDGLDGDGDGGADCADPEALAVQAGGDLSVNIPNCYVVRFCDLDPSNDCPP